MEALLRLLLLKENAGMYIMLVTFFIRYFANDFKTFAGMHLSVIGNQRLEGTLFIQ